MESSYRHIDVTVDQDVFCVHLKQPRLEEHEVEEFGKELVSVVKGRGSRKMVFCFGPNSPQVLYSVFLAKLVVAHHHLQELKGCLILCEANEDIMGVFRACKLDSYFEFAPNRATAVATLIHRQ